MSLAEAIMDEVKSMSDEQKTEVLDFAKALKMRRDKAFNKALDDIVAEHREAFEELAK